MIRKPLPTSYLNSRSEWLLLELITLKPESSKEKETFDKLMKSNGLNWGELLEQALRHKILPLLAFDTTSNQFIETLPKLVRRHLRTTLDLNKYNNTILYNEAARIIKILESQDVRFVGTKGITLESTIYNNNGSRRLGDMDFMVLPKYRNVITRTMSQLGYQMGGFNWSTYKVRPLNREEKTIFKLNPDHLPHFIKLTEDPVVPFVDVDFANSLTWTCSPFNVPIEDALAEIVYQPIPGISDVQMPCFNSKFQFIFTILHLFREAWVFREGWVDTINDGWETDVTLSKFADVIRLWKAYEKELNTPEFIQILEKYEIMNPILWVLEHTDRTFNTNILPTLGLEGRVTEEWLHSAGGLGGKLIQWKGTMRERLYCKDRRKLFITDSEN